MQNNQQLPKSRLYVWEKYDDFFRITVKLTGTVDHWNKILDHNMGVLKSNNYLMRPGDVIEIPDNFEGTFNYLETNKYTEVVVKEVATGRVSVMLQKVYTNELDTLLLGPKSIPRGFVRVTETIDA